MKARSSNIKGGVPLVSARTVLRAGFVAILIGAILTGVNQWRALTGAHDFLIVPGILVFQTPFLVVLTAQAFAIEQANREFNSNLVPTDVKESFFQTVVAHRIPGRALLLGILMGTTNTAIVAIANTLTTGTALPLPTTLISQAFILPVFFGLISQSITFRRTVSQLAKTNPQSLKGERS